VLAKSDLLIIAAPHPQYATLATAKPVVDIWNIRGQGVRV
jgi:UDP-N-acetyl-D-mannosaminuronic acid dehydrogenase